MKITIEFDPKLDQKPESMPEDENTIVYNDVRELFLCTWSEANKWQRTYFSIGHTIGIMGQLAEFKEEVRIADLVQLHNAMKQVANR